MSNSLEIKSKSVQVTAAYEGEVYKSEITFTQNQDGVNNVSMSIYKKGNGAYVGNGNASQGGTDGSLQWSVNSVPQSLLTEVTAFVDEIASSISEYAASANVASLSD